MTDEKKPNKWDEIRKTGILAFVLSIPVLIWKSTKTGRTISWIFVAMFIFWFTGNLADVVFSKIINRVEIKSESAKTLTSVRKLKEDVDTVSRYVSRIDDYVKRESKKRGDQVLSEYREKFKGLDGQITELEKSIDTFRADQRAAVKDRIVLLREAVKVGQENTDSAKTRMEFEDLIKNINILSPEEKDRFIKDLKDMGFYVEQVKERVTAHHQGMMFTSYDIAMPRSVVMSTSTDSFYFRNAYEED